MISIISAVARNSRGGSIHPSLVETRQIHAITALNSNPCAPEIQANGFRTYQHPQNASPREKERHWVQQVDAWRQCIESSAAGRLRGLQPSV
jgi:hypothetical protein